MLDDEDGKKLGNNLGYSITLYIPELHPDLDHHENFRKDGQSF